MKADAFAARDASAVAIRRFLADGTADAIVNVSSHQAQRAVPGALPYVTAKAAIEGLTRALAVEITGRISSRPKSGEVDR